MGVEVVVVVGVEVEVEVGVGVEVVVEVEVVVGVEVGVTYSWEPLDRYLERRWPQIFEKTAGSAGRPTDHPSGGYSATHPMHKSQAFEVLGVSNSMYYARRKQMLSDADADLFATRLGLHPVQLWPSWFADAPLEAAQ